MIVRALIIDDLNVKLLVNALQGIQFSKHTCLKDVHVLQLKTNEFFSCL